MNRFISRSTKYAVKMLINGVGRIYIKNSEELRVCDFFAKSRIKVDCKPNRIEITLCENGTKSIYDSARGELLELKDKAVGESMKGHEFVTVTFRKGKIIITGHVQSMAQQSRVKRFYQTIKDGKPLRTGSFFSGIGMLMYHIKQGLALSGIQTEVAFANESNPLAMAVNLEGNPVWETPAEDAVAITDELQHLIVDELKELDVVEVGYPCVGFSLLADIEQLDTEHKMCGLLFIPLINALKKLNPAVMIFENTPRFMQSQTLSIIKRSFPDYQFSEKVFDGHEYGELESRKRACIVATSHGMPAFDLDVVSPVLETKQMHVRDILKPIADDAPAWRVMAHVKARETMKNVNFKNHVYYGDETKMVTLPATYSSPKAGTPMIGHPSDPSLQRQVQVDEHSALRELPGKLANVVHKVWKGEHPMVSTRGSATACHRMLGNGVSRRIWTSIGAFIGLHFDDNDNSTCTS